LEEALLGFANVRMGQVLGLAGEKSAKCAGKLDQPPTF
jgi:hypothetical protein